MAGGGGGDCRTFFEMVLVNCRVGRIYYILLKRQLCHIPKNIIHKFYTVAISPLFNDLTSLTKEYSGKLKTLI